MHFHTNRRVGTQVPTSETFETQPAALTALMNKVAVEMQRHDAQVTYMGSFGTLSMIETRTPATEDEVTFASWACTCGETEA